MPDSNPKFLKPCVFFDRDGVVNQSPGPGYVLRWEDFHFNPGFIDAFKTVKANGYLAVLITSQKGVGKGLMPLSELNRIHENMQQFIESETGERFDGIFAFTGLPDCPHQPKPNPEMIFAAQTALSLDLKASWMIGDADRDILMGKAAGLGGTIRIKTDKPINPEAIANHTLTNIIDLSNILTDKLSAGN